MNRVTLLALTALVAAVAAAHADVVVLEAVADNTLYQSATGARSNGAGPVMFAGNNDNSESRRAVLRFDVSGIPAGSIVTAVELALHVSRTRAGPTTVAVHRLLADWGEGTSVAGGEGGGGAPSTPGDATWIHRFFSTTTWAAAGGDFALAASASTSVGDIATYTWGSTAPLVADVQDWVDRVAPNHGFIVIGAEVGRQTAKRFDSRENPVAANRPRLTVTYTVAAPTGACCDALGACSVTTPATCSGTYQGDGTTCSPDPCLVAPTGACCDTAGACTVTTPAACSGTYQGDGTTCSPDPCLVAPTGACCQDTACSDGTTATGCQLMGGIYQGNGQTCATAPCDDESRACCFGDGSCVVMNRDLCDAMGGDRQGGGSTCAINPCVQGACCVGLACFEDTTSGECLELAGTHVAGGTCAPDPCAPGCDAAAIARIGLLRAVRAGGGRSDVSLTWSADPAASEYNTYLVTAKSGIPGASRAGGAATAPGCAGRTAPDCVHAGAVPPAAGTELFYNVIGGCDGTEAAE